MAGLLFILPSLLGVCIFLLIPFIDVVRRSFTGAVSGAFVGLDNYINIFQTPAFLLAGKNTLRFTAVCIPILLFLSLFIAVFLQKQKRFGRLLKSTFLIPMAIPVASVVLLWRLLFHGNGILNGILGGLGVSGQNWMNTDYAFGILVFSYVWKNLGYDIVLWVAGLSSISPDIYEAARVDGAGEWKCFTKITMPNLLPSLYTISVLSFLNSFKVFREAYLVAGDYPHESMYMMQHLFNNWFRELSLDKMAAGAVINALIIFILITLLQRAWERG
ncbi:MAG: sugar ABC transporter permease [Lachnospiraceae bacterium]|nr:sugar ABC transporter permease [Lachnospiraceae bacterium]